MTPDLAGRAGAAAVLALLCLWAAWERTEHVPRWLAIEAARTAEEGR